MKVEFIFKIEPVAKGRPKISARGGFARAYTPIKTRNFEQELAILAKNQFNGVLIDYPIGIDIKFFLNRPKSISEKKRPLPSVKPDLDNYIKCIDALNGIIWVDDSLICKIEASKQYSSSEGFIVLNIKPM